MRILSYFAKPSFEVLKIRTSKNPKGQLKGSQAKKAVKKMVELNEQRERHGSHRRASPEPKATLIRSNSTDTRTTASGDFASKNGSQFDRMAVEKNLDTFDMFQPATAASRGKRLTKTSSKGTDADASLILPVPNRHSRKQLRFWEAVGATSDRSSP